MNHIIQSWNFVSPRNRVAFLTLTIFRMASGVFDLVGIFLIGLIGILAVSPSGQEQSISLLGIQYSIVSSPDFISRLIVFAFLLYIGKAIYALILNKLNYRKLAQIDLEMSRKTASSFFYGPFASLRSKSKADVQWTLLESVTQASFQTLGSAANLIVDLFSLMMILILLMLVNPIACLVVAMYFFALTFLLQKIIGKAQFRIGLDQSKYSRLTWSSVEDGYVSYRENFVLKQLDVVLERIVSNRSELTSAISKNLFWASVPKAVSEVALMLGTLAFVIWQFLSGSFEESVGIIAIFLAAGVRIMSAMGPIQNALASLKNAAAQSRLAKEEMLLFSEQMVPTVIRSSLATPSSNKRGYSVEAKDLSFSFEDSQELIVNNVSFNIPAGSFAAIIGPSGSGKTTLVDLLLGLFKPISGKVQVDGKSIDLVLNQLPESIAYVPQKPALISGTFQENITLWQKEEYFDAEHYNFAVNAAGLRELEESLPGKSSFVIDGGSANLSGGQIQRIGLARAIYRKPKLIILDEATSALDAETEHDVNKAILSLLPSTSLLVIAHRLSTVQKADVVFLMEQGAITAKGSFADLRKNHPVVQKYVNLMSFED